MKTNAKKIVAQVLFFITYAFSHSVYSQEIDCKLDRKEKAMLKKEFGNWDIVKIDNLRDEDKIFWKKSKKNRCPGMVSGHFIKLETANKAVSIFSESNGKKNQAVIVFDGKTVKKYHVLDRAEDVAFLSVLASVNDKNLIDSDGNKIRIKHSALIYEALESGKIIFYFDKSWKKYYID